MRAASICLDLATKMESGPRRNQGFGYAYRDHAPVWVLRYEDPKQGLNEPRDGRAGKTALERASKGKTLWLPVP